MIVLNRTLLGLLAFASGLLFALHHPVSMPSESAVMDAFATEQGARIVWAQPESTLCGKASGCYLPTTDYVAVTVGMPEAWTWEVVRHEVAHVLITRVCSDAVDEPATEAYSDLYLGGDPALNGYRYGVGDVERAKNYRKGVC